MLKRLPHIIGYLRVPLGVESLFLLLEQGLHDDDSVDWIIKKGFDAHLDRLRVLKEILKEKTMLHMTHNYMLGLAVLVFSFVFFYVPMVYAFVAIRHQKRKQNK